MSTVTQWESQELHMRRFAAAIQELWIAWQYGSFDQQPWMYSVSLSSLKTLGMCDADLRWLISQEYVRHARDRTRDRSRKRLLTPAGQGAFHSNSCFILTDRGANFFATSAHFASGVPRPVRPRWDASIRRLMVGDIVVKHFTLPAPNQQAILSAFQEQGWPERTDDPLRPVANQDSARRLHDTIRALNRHLQCRLIRFHGDGTGKGIRWSFIDRPVPVPSASPELRVDNANLSM